MIENVESEVEEEQEESSEYTDTSLDSEIDQVAATVEIAEFQQSKNTKLYQLMQKAQGVKLQKQHLKKEKIDLDVLFQDLYTLIKNLP